MFVEVDKLEDKINELKKELIQIAAATGLNSYDTLHCSQTLDQHITTYQQYLRKSNQFQKN